MTTDYQSKYLASLLDLQGASDSVESLSRSFANARVKLNPHQVDAALFAFRSPLSKGVILADEVGLGKTIEAGIVILQKWAERKRNILLILPASLRNQWQQELSDKFFLPSVVLEAKTFNEMKKAGNPNPFNQQNKIVICSYRFASNKAREVGLAAARWIAPIQSSSAASSVAVTNFLHRLWRRSVPLFLPRVCCRCVSHAIISWP